MRLYLGGEMTQPLVRADYQYVDNRPADHVDPFGLVSAPPSMPMPPTPPPPLPPGGPNQQWVDDVNDWHQDNQWWFLRNPPPRDLPKRQPEMCRGRGDAASQGGGTAVVQVAAPRPQTEPQPRPLDMEERRRPRRRSAIRTRPSS